MIEKEIEEVLKSSKPRECFTDKSIDIDSTLARLWVMIGEAGDAQALREASKLLKLDEQAMNKRNPFIVAYQGFDLGNPAIDKRLLTWAQELLREEIPKLSNPIFDIPISLAASGLRRWWSAMAGHRPSRSGRPIPSPPD
jgi:hypothetical protein